MNEKVVNASGTGGQHCSCCDSWLAHWKNNNPGRSRTDCAVSGCTNKAAVGGHVKRDGLFSTLLGFTFIVPLCTAHNHPTNTEAMTLNAGVALVSPNTQDDCYRTT